METNGGIVNDRNDLIAAAQNGDIKAFHKLFSDFQNQLKSYLYRILADRNDVDALKNG